MVGKEFLIVGETRDSDIRVQELSIGERDLTSYVGVVHVGVQGGRVKGAVDDVQTQGKVCSISCPCDLQRHAVYERPSRVTPLWLWW